MPTYSITPKAGGPEVYRYVADQRMEWLAWPFEEFDYTEVPDQESAPTAPPEPISWTVVEFQRRMTSEERVAIRTRAKTDVLLEDFMALMSDSPAIHNDDPDVQKGLGYLTYLGILAEGRAAAILSGH